MPMTRPPRPAPRHAPRRTVFRATVSAFALGAILAGCSVVESRNLGPSSAEPVSANLVYTLPRLLIQATVVKRGGRHFIRTVPPPGTADATIKNNEADGIADGVRIQGDPAHVYTLRYTPSILSDDEFTAELEGETGFVSLIDGKTTDRTFETIQKGVEVAAQFFSADGDQQPERAVAETVVQRLLFDPHVDLPAVNKVIKEYNLVFECEECAPPAPPGPPIEGVYIRPTKTVRLVLRRIEEDGKTPVVSITSLPSPNGSRLVALPVERSLGVTRTVKYEKFAAGAPTRFVENKPAEALGVVTGIAGVAGAIVAAPIQAATQQMGEADVETKLLESETKRVEAQAKLVNAQAALEEAGQNSNPETDGVGGDGGTNQEGAGADGTSSGATDPKKLAEQAK
ncbi:MAG: hypothetical protein AAF371_16665 [Pseudomonadota bacterium]